jgi:hypothetical protein
MVARWSMVDEVERSVSGICPFICHSTDIDAFADRADELIHNLEE